MLCYLFFMSSVHIFSYFLSAILHLHTLFSSYLYLFSSYLYLFSSYLLYFLAIFLYFVSIFLYFVYILYLSTEADISDWDCWRMPEKKEKNTVKNLNIQFFRYQYSITINKNKVIHTLGGITELSRPGFSKT